MKRVLFWPLKFNLLGVCRAQIVLGAGLGVQLIDLTSSNGLKDVLNIEGPHLN